MRGLCFFTAIWHLLYFIGLYYGFINASKIIPCFLTAHDETKKSSSLLAEADSMCHSDLPTGCVGKHWGVLLQLGGCQSRQHGSFLANAYGTFGPSQSFGSKSHGCTDSGLGILFSYLGWDGR